jgi:hypothetical protein
LLAGAEKPVDVMGAGFGGGAGADISNRSPMELLAAGVLLVVAAGDAEEKSPKSFPKLLLAWCETREGGEVGLGGGVGAAAGFISKKLPPLRDDFCIEGCLECPEGGEKLENGAGLDCVVLEDIDSEPNASPKPLNDCVFDWGDAGFDVCMPPKAFAAG